MGSISPTNNHALIFGASGITGWAIVNAILNEYPSPNVFNRVTALTNRPLPREVAQWPSSDKLQVISGLDLLRGDQAMLEGEMTRRVPGIETATHAYFFAYVMDMNAETEIQINVDLLRRAVTAVEHLSSQLKFVVLPTGTKVSMDFPCIDAVLASDTSSGNLRLMECTSSITFLFPTICLCGNPFLVSPSPTLPKCSTTASLTCSSHSPRGSCGPTAILFQMSASHTRQ